MYTQTVNRSLSKNQIALLANDDLLAHVDDLTDRCMAAGGTLLNDLRRQLDALMVEARKRKLVYWGEFARRR